MDSYREKKEKERLLLSTIYVFGSTIAIFLILFLLDLLQFEDFNEYTGPVKITFGSPDSNIETAPIIKPEIIKPKEAVPLKEESKAIPEPAVNPPLPETKSNELKKDVPKVDESKRAEPVKKVEEKPIVEEVPVIQKGRESGNSHETSFESTSSKIGRRAYFPIYQFMPLPKRVSLDVFSLIDGDVTGFGDKNYNRDLFNRFYLDRGSYFSLPDSVPLQNRPELWEILKLAGYDIENADYKKDKNLRAVIISFEINKNSNGLNAIKSSTVITSSGYEEIDEAVLYGFNQSTYSNSTNDLVKGRFKYSFK